MPGLKSLISDWTSVWRPPSAFMRRLFSRPAMKPPWAGVLMWIMDSGPTSWMASSMASAMPVRASSQETRFHLPSPRSPARFRG